VRWKVALAALAFSWGVVSVIVAGVAVPADALVFWRCLLAVVSTLVVLAALGRLSMLGVPGEGRRIFVIGVALGLHWFLFFEALKRASVSVAILTLYTAPIFVAIAAPRVLGERRTKTGLVALALSAPGVALIALAGEGGTHADPLAVACGLGSAGFYAFLILRLKVVTPHVSPPILGFWQYVVVAIVFAPLALTGPGALPGAASWPGVAVLGIVFTAGTSAAYYFLLRHVSAQNASLLAYLEPVSASFLAWVLLGQPLGWQVALGGAAVLAGGMLVVLSGTRRAEPTARSFQPAVSALKPGAIK
jgi:drug/metabolite transporter (DMT)-like permease